LVVKVESVTEEIGNALGAHLEQAIKGLRTMNGFPEANMPLKYPTISMTIKTMAHTNIWPYVHKIGPVATNKALVQYVTGSYDFSMQLDIFERSKEEREDLYQKFYSVFNRDFPRPGLKLVLENYYNIVCSYQITRYAPDMTNDRSMTKDWRAVVDIEGNCMAIREASQPIITQLPDVTLDAETDIVIT